MGFTAEELDVLANLALQAGEAILRVYERPDLQPQIKRDGSPVTEADQAAEAIIVAGLARHWPETPVVAEEAMSAGASPSIGERFFLVDPLDGTREFLDRNGDFTVNIALVEDGAPAAGVVHAPVHRQIWAGALGHGARRADVTDGPLGSWRPVAVRQPPPALHVLASRSHLTPETGAFIARFPVAAWVSAGSSLKFCRLAEGAADLYPRLGRTMEWDTAAGDAVLRAAGGAVRTMDGLPLAYGKLDTGEGKFVNPWFVASGPFDPFAWAAS